MTALTQILQLLEFLSEKERELLGKKIQTLPSEIITKANEKHQKVFKKSIQFSITDKSDGANKIYECTAITSFGTFIGIGNSHREAKYQSCKKILEKFA